MAKKSISSDEATGPEIFVTITITDPEIEADFYKTFRKQNDNDFLQAVGGTVDALQAATVEDEKAFVCDLISGKIAADYLSLKVQQATQEFQKELITSAQDSLKPRKTLVVKIGRIQ